MTLTTQTQSVTPKRGGSGFQPIPTRIRDVRASQGVPPLVVDSPQSELSAEMAAALREMTAKLTEIHNTAAEAYLSQGLYEQALPHLEVAVNFAPTNVEYRHQLGFVRYITGDDVGSIDAFNKVLESDPDNSEAWFNLGMVLFGQEQFIEAESCFKKAIDGDPSEAQTWNNRGVCLWKMDRGEDAGACFQRALQIDPGDEDARFNLDNFS